MAGTVLMGRGDTSHLLMSWNGYHVVLSREK